MNGGGGLLFFVDNNPKKYDQLVKLSHKGKEANFAIKNPKEILNTDFDKIYITSLTGCDSILKQLSSYGVDMLKVDYIYSRVKIDARVNFLKSFSKDCKDKKLFGEVAELGVFQGEFAKEIHKFFQIKSFIFLIPLRVLMRGICKKKMRLPRKWAHI